MSRKTPSFTWTTVRLGWPGSATSRVLVICVCRSLRHVIYQYHFPLCIDGVARTVPLDPHFGRVGIVAFDNTFDLLSFVDNVNTVPLIDEPHHQDVATR